MMTPVIRALPRPLRRKLACESRHEAMASVDVMRAGGTAPIPLRRAPWIALAPWKKITPNRTMTPRSIYRETSRESHQSSTYTTNRRQWRALLQGLLWAGVLAVSPTFGATPEFAAVTPDHAITLPDDTGAHPAFRTEWWYATGWLTTPDHQALGFQITFFRSSTGHSAADPSAFAPSQLIIAHAALSDPAFGRLAHDQRIARQG